ncbi:MAG: hypothetical protein V3T30_01925 [Thermodesulfobacteriota bacterium]
MNIKKFTGETLEGALKEVKISFGEEALILSTKKGEGFSEVIAAVDFDIDDVEEKMAQADEFKEGFLNIKSELAELRSLFAATVGDTVKRDMVELGDGALDIYERLLGNGVSGTLSEKLVKMAAMATTDGASKIQARCLALVREKLNVYNPFAGSGGPKILALVGPTGVGKSTTVAKLAGGLSKDGGADVGIISLGSGKLGGAEAIKRCGSVFGVTVASATNREELNRALWRSKNKDVILIDTPGRNPKDTKSINAIKKILDCGLPVKQGLVLSVTSRDEAQEEACRGFGELPLDCLLFTKIDEAEKYGTILNSSTMLDKPVAYLCNGQSIPRDIGSASKESIGNLVLQ